MTKRSYTEAVLKGIDEALAAQTAAAPAPINAIEVRLLLSIDRREDREAALDTARLAVELKGQGVVGLDLSGVLWQLTPLSFSLNWFHSNEELGYPLKQHNQPLKGSSFDVDRAYWSNMK